MSVVCVQMRHAISPIGWWLVALPFTLLKWTFQLLAALFALPFLLVFGLLGVVVFGAGALVLFLLPALPFIFIAWVVWALMKRRHPAGATTT